LALDCAESQSAWPGPFSTALVTGHGQDDTSLAQLAAFGGNTGK
jgi:hypothetical protein